MYLRTGSEFLQVFTETSFFSEEKGKKSSEGNYFFSVYQSGQKKNQAALLSSVKGVQGAYKKCLPL